MVIINRSTAFEIAKERVKKEKKKIWIVRNSKGTYELKTDRNVVLHEEIEGVVLSSGVILERKVEY